MAKKLTERKAQFDSKFSAKFFKPDPKPNSKALKISEQVTQPYKKSH